MGPHLIILAAGKGKRMQSRLPKILHPIMYRPMIHYVLDLAKSLPHASISMVVGHGEQEVKANCRDYPDVRFFEQREQLGTAHAVRMTEPFLKEQKGSVVILSGDVILLRRETLEGLVEQHAKSGSACTVATAKLEKPHGYGRILRDGEERFVGIREEADASPAERAICEVNSGLYCYDVRELLAALSEVGNENRQGEYYLPDTIKVLGQKHKPISTYSLGDPDEMTGINDRAALAEVENILQARLNRDLMLKGVTLEQPSSTRIDPRCKIGVDVRIEGGCTLINSIIESGAHIESGSRIIESVVGAHAHIKQGSYIEKSAIGAECNVGPYAHLRPESRLERGVKIGNFVELKKATMAEGSKASHLSYIGDAEIGKNANLGCGFITCNYDGFKKHRTVIEADVFVGSDSQVVAPIRIGSGSYVASGTTVTEDVPSDSLVISRNRQVVKPGYAKKYRSPKNS